MNRPSIIAWIGNKPYIRDRFIDNFPLLCEWIAPSTRDSRVQPESDLAIIGFPRSGNTFVRFAITYFQESSFIQIASHHHYVAQIKLAIRYGVPVLVLLRNPADAVSSLKLRTPETCLRRALRKYLYFYRYVYRRRRSVVITLFPQVVNEPEAAVRAINQRFGRKFSSWKLSDGEVQQLKQEIIQQELQYFPDRKEQPLALPSLKKEQEKLSVKEELNQNHPELLQAANQIYQKLKRWVQ